MAIFLGGNFPSWLRQTESNENPNIFEYSHYCHLIRKVQLFFLITQNHWLERGGARPSLQSPRKTMVEGNCQDAADANSTAKKKGCLSHRRNRDETRIIKIRRKVSKTDSQTSPLKSSSHLCFICGKKFLGRTVFSARYLHDAFGTLRAELRLAMPYATRPARRANFLVPEKDFDVAATSTLLHLAMWL